MFAALYLLLGEPMLPYAQGWAVFFLWVCAHIGGFIAIKVGLPPLLGMLIVGIILKNIPQGDGAPALTDSMNGFIKHATHDVWPASGLSMV